MVPLARPFDSEAGEQAYRALTGRTEWNGGRDGGTMGSWADFALVPAAMPQQQLDDMKIRADANLGASMVFTLPEELAQDDEQSLDAWAQATMDWIRDNAPGELSYAAVHRDEPGARPHNYAMMLPMDENGAVNYKLHYGRHDLSEELQDSYTEALLPLGVMPKSGETRAMLKPTYTPFANLEGAEISSTLRRVPEAAERLAEKGRQQTARKSDADRTDQDLEQRATAR